MVYQQSSTDSVQCKLKIGRNNQNRYLKDDPFPPTKLCLKTTPLNQKHSAFESNMKDVDVYRKWDSIWFLTKTLKGEMESETPTRVAYNSLITKALPITMYCGLPLYPAPPTHWTNLYAALQIYQNISTMTYPEGKTIISLDILLYARALLFQSKDELNRNFQFRVGELHYSICSNVRTEGKG